MFTILVLSYNSMHSATTPGLHKCLTKTTLEKTASLVNLFKTWYTFTMVTHACAPMFALKWQNSQQTASLIQTTVVSGKKKSVWILSER